MSWPPDDDGLDFCAQADKVDLNWDFVIPTAHWQLAADSDDELPEDLDAEIKQLFRAAWKEARSKSPTARGYLRFHDSTWAIDLNTGRKVRDRDRSDFVEPERKSFSKKGRSTKKKAA